MHKVVIAQSESYRSIVFEPVNSTGLPISRKIMRHSPERQDRDLEREHSLEVHWHSFRVTILFLVRNNHSALNVPQICIDTNDTSMNSDRVIERAQWNVQVSIHTIFGTQYLQRDKRWGRVQSNCPCHSFMSPKADHPVHLEISREQII
jgi:hypothetical protein